jgi:hypothetical protein
MSTDVEAGKETGAGLRECGTEVNMALGNLGGMKKDWPKIDFSYLENRLRAIEAYLAVLPRAPSELERELADALGLAVADGSDGCRRCDDPKAGLFADVVNDECGWECNEVLCGKCAIKELIARAREAGQ